VAHVGPFASNPMSWGAILGAGLGIFVSSSCLVWFTSSICTTTTTLQAGTTMVIGDIAQLPMLCSPYFIPNVVERVT
jgi:hypothetical protein